MPKVKFTADYDWHPRAGVIIAYRAGMERTVTRRCAERAVAAGVAKRVRARKVKEDDNDQGNDDQGQQGHPLSGG